MRPRPRVLFSVGIPLLLVLLVVAAWGIDTAAAGDQVLRNTTLHGRAIGGQDGDGDLRDVVAALAEDFADTPVRIEADGEVYRSTAGELGLRVDEAATSRAALDVGRDGPLPARPFTWLASFAAAREAPIRYELRADALTVGLAGLQDEKFVRPVEPSLVGTPTTVGVRRGVTGHVLDEKDVAEKLLADAAKGEEPIRIKTTLVERRPRISDGAAERLAAVVEANTDEPLEVVAGYSVTTVDVPTIRSWIGSRPTDGGLRLVLDEAKVLADLRSRFIEASAPVDARFNVVGDGVEVVPSRDGFSCCVEDAPDKVLAAIEAGRNRFEVGLVKREPGLTTEEALKLGIREKVGTTTTWKGQPQVKQFTTYHQSGQPRVTNIHRMADILRGLVIEPGETFSINETVGPRTSAKGFVDAPVIYEGRMESDVGGGVSQFATTMFNAAFFAGLDLVEYQSHSLYIDRYPRGREATLSYPDPDLKIRNNTPYGVMIWPTYTDSSITVAFYSTPHVIGEQTGQRSERRGACTRVVTSRIRRYADGRTDTDDVAATYRPAEGVNC